MDGILIAVEGVDGAGKTTQVQRLETVLRESGRDVVVSKEPTNGPWGRKIRESARSGRMSLEDELHAFLEDRKQHVAELIQPSLEAGRVVLLDRYFYSTIAYQGARGAEVDQLLERNLAIAPTPTRVLLIDIDPAVSVERIRSGRGETPDEFEGVEYLSRVRQIFNQLADSRDEVCRFDGTQSIDDVEAAIHAELASLGLP